jgi:hypothetical protein
MSSRGMVGCHARASETLGLPRDKRVSGLGSLACEPGTGFGSQPAEMLG